LRFPPFFPAKASLLSRIHPKKIREAGFPYRTRPLPPAVSRLSAADRQSVRTRSNNLPVSFFVVRIPAPLSGLPPHPVSFIGGTPRRPFLQPGFCKIPFGFASHGGSFPFPVDATQRKSFSARRSLSLRR